MAARNYPRFLSVLGGLGRIFDSGEIARSREYCEAGGESPLSGRRKLRRHFGKMFMYLLVGAQLAAEPVLSQEVPSVKLQSGTLVSATNWWTNYPSSITHTT